MKFVCFICATALFIALFPMPNEYYVFLRCLVSGGAVAVLIQEMKKDVNLLGISFIAIVLFFNPIVPIYLFKKIIWMSLDCITFMLFIIYGFNYKPNT